MNQLSQLFIAILWLLSLSTNAFAIEREPIDDLLNRIHRDDRFVLYLIASPEVLYQKLYQPIYQKYHSFVAQNQSIDLFSSIYTSIDPKHSVILIENTENQKQLLLFVAKANTTLQMLEKAPSPTFKFAEFAGRFAIEIDQHQNTAHTSTIDFTQWFKAKSMIAFEQTEISKHCSMKKGEADLFVIQHEIACFTLAFHANHVLAQLKINDQKQWFQTWLSVLAPIELKDEQALFSFSMHLIPEKYQALLMLVPPETQAIYQKLFDHLIQNTDGNLLLSWYALDQFALLFAKKNQNNQLAPMDLLITKEEQLHFRDGVDVAQIYYNKPLTSIQRSNKDTAPLIYLQMKSTGLPKNAIDLKDLAVHRLKISPEDMKNFEWVFEFFARMNQWIGDIALELNRLSNTDYELTLKMKLY